MWSRKDLPFGRVTLKTEMYFLTLWNARFFVVLFRVFGIRSLHCFSHLIERVTIRVSVYIGILLQFKVTRRHLSLYFCQFSFTFAGNFYVQLNQLNYRNVEIFRNLCTYSRRFDVISMSGYFVVILVIL